MLTLPEIRIELLKITHAHGRAIDETLARARAMEEYVLLPSVAESKPRRKVAPVLRDTSEEPQEF